ncbi:sporulation protein [Vibrio algarum]|uniref:Sporulation protein n=1 Tax=Vibrio algarum TaxID=3020714 RepID=A0ABT4YM45_9VIBR|nr:sporulation protein [Vibrio sp. KJ40-1]MDB1122568.1 sporulation protein [Vibrio sp. KJ40-1]
MSFLKKTLASFGIGSARVDSVLQQEFLIPGEKANIAIHVYGGATPQDIDNIDLKIYCRYIEEVPADNDKNKNDNYMGRMKRVPRDYVLASWKLPYSFVIESGQQRDFDVELDIPANTPVTIGDTKVWLETGLDVSMAKDPTDKDILTVRPTPTLDGVISALEEEGLRIRQVECEATKGFALPFVQEFELVPTTGQFHGRWRELEIVAYQHDDALELWFEVDRQKKGLGGMLSNLLGTGKLKRNIVIPQGTEPDEAGKQVIAYLESTT